MEKLMEQNLNTYSSDTIVSYYANYEGLQKPEQTILDLLKNKIAKGKMLDVGIGAGRTTKFFAPLVNEYVGVDYSEGMVEACRKKFKNQYSHAVYKWADARDLSAFPPVSFDFVLFSFNGLDGISYEDREKALKEMKKVLKEGAYFCFSTHNIKSLENMKGFVFRLNVFAMVKRIFDVRKIKRINKEELQNLESKKQVFVNDGAHNYGLKLCYVRPSAQVEQLRRLGYKEVSVFSLITGKILSSSQEIDAAEDKWLYFLCR